MKAPAFDYNAPTSVDEAVSLLQQHADDSAVLAGGQSLTPLLALRLATPAVIIDINRVEGISAITRDNGTVRIGALVRHAALTRRGTPADAVPLLGEAAPFIGHFQIRNRGTVCGSLTHADSAAEWPLIARTLDAAITLRSMDGTRDVAAGDFFEGPYTTSKKSNELAVSVQFPVWSPNAGFALEEFARRSGDFGIAGAACAVEVSGGKVSRCAIGLMGLAAVPLRAEHAEQALTGASVSDIDPVEIGQLATADLEAPADIHASAHYRRRIGAAMVAKALARALGEAKDV